MKVCKRFNSLLSHCLKEGFFNALASLVSTVYTEFTPLECRNFRWNQQGKCILIEYRFHLPLIFKKEEKYETDW